MSSNCNLGCCQHDMRVELQPTPYKFLIILQGEALMLRNGALR
jgi:hypothetical protein